MAEFSGKITPFLWFENQSEEAAHFYASVFPDSSVGQVTKTPGEDTVLTVAFTLCGLPFTALNGGDQFTFNESISFAVACDDQQEVDTYWEKLLDGGGKEIACGWLKDKYGLCWQIVPTRMFELLADPDPARAGRAFNAMQKMMKLDIKALEAAADGSTVPSGQAG